MAVAKSNSVNDSVKSVKAYIESQLTAGSNVELSESIVGGKKVITITAKSFGEVITSWGKINGAITAQSDLLAMFNKYLKSTDFEEVIQSYMLESDIKILLNGYVLKSDLDLDLGSIDGGTSLG